MMLAGDVFGNRGAERGTEKWPNWLSKRALLTPHRIAARYGRETVTFAQLHEDARRKAQALLGLGVRPGDLVAIYSRNHLHALSLICAVAYAGAVLLPINLRLSVDEAAFQLADSGARFVVHDEESASFVRQCLEAAVRMKRDEAADGQAVPVPVPATAISHHELEKLANSAERKEGPEQPMLSEYVDPGSPATIMYTSGTTGRPKGVVQTWGNHWASAIGSALNLGLREDDCWLVCLPMYHISGLSAVYKSLIYGMCIEIMERFDPRAVNEAILSGRISIISVVTAMLNRMVDDLDELDNRSYPERLRCVLLGGGPVPLPLLERCVAKGIPVYQSYGMTETASQIATLSPDYMLSKLGSAGKPLFLSELRIVNERNEDASPLESGEILVRGPNVTPGYFNRPEATREAFRDGWLRTGDIGYVDEDGFLYVQDRRSDLIISGGENVYPAEIESVLAAHEAVLEAGVTGVDHPVWGKTPAAFVVVRSFPQSESEREALKQELLRHCREKLAKYKVPADIHFVAALPRNGTNKLLRRELVRLLPQENRPAEGDRFSHGNQHPQEPRISGSQMDRTRGEGDSH
jgi:O-succinylbenzoic acid--CoA ligase